jgi:uncharacterized membrane protein YeaQ/YmgE (transglycosylase-associated protein family)
MGILSWILFGLLAGAVARLIVPGRQSIGCLATLAIGVIGAFVGGLIGEVIFGHKVHFGWDLGPFLLAVAGAVLLLLALDTIAGRRRRMF